MTSRRSVSRGLRPALIVGAFVLLLGACTSGSDDATDPGATTDAPPSSESTTTAEAAPRPPAPTIPRPPTSPAVPTALDNCSNVRLLNAYNDQGPEVDEDFLGGLTSELIAARVCEDAFGALQGSFENDANPQVILFVKDNGAWRLIGRSDADDPQFCADAGAPADLCVSR